MPLPSLATLVCGMGGRSGRQEGKGEGKGKDKTGREKPAAYSFDLSGLPFAGLVTGAIIPLYPDLSDENNRYSICTGIISAIVSAAFADKISE